MKTADELYIWKQTINVKEILESSSCRALPYLKTEFLWIMISFQRSAECMEFESWKALWSSKEYGHQTLSFEYLWEIIYRFLEKKKIEGSSIIIIFTYVIVHIMWSYQVMDLRQKLLSAYSCLGEFSKHRTRSNPPYLIHNLL